MASGPLDPPDLEGFVEAFGVAMEGSGLQRGAGRVLGWLLVCDPPEQTAADLVEALRASTGAVSQNLRILLHLQLVERTGYRGDRRSFYRVAPGATRK